MAHPTELPENSSDEGKQEEVAFVEILLQAGHEAQRNRY
jgi:hypothetical protein